jgi:hypothetical protein
MDDGDATVEIIYRKFDRIWAMYVLAETAVGTATVGTWYITLKFKIRNTEI